MAASAPIAGAEPIQNLGCGDGELKLALDVQEGGLPEHVSPLHPDSVPDGSEELPGSLLEAAAAVMAEPDVYMKARLTFVACAAFEAGSLPILPKDLAVAAALSAPDAPARPSWVSTVAANKQSSGGKKGMVHSVVHAESYAIDLSWDIMLRFGVKEGQLEQPREFFMDWARVALDEAKHFSMWAQRLTALGCKYGDLPGHDGLWQSATETADSLMARLAVVHMVHEARGLDVAPGMLAKLAKSQDDDSRRILTANYAEEITHVGAGHKWFVLTARAGGVADADIPAAFHDTVKAHFRGALKPPFNHEARSAAGMTREWYEPLAA